MLAHDKAGHAEFRRLLAANTVTHLDRYIHAAARRGAADSPAD
jgi:hypothetical protein